MPGVTVPLKLLLVDDDEVDRLAVRRALVASGLKHELVESADSEDALRLLLGQRFDGLLLDFRMPRVDGRAVLERIRAVGLDTPVVMLTGQGDEATAVELMKAGAADYIVKSALTPTRLAHGVLAAMKLHAAQRAARDAQEALRRQVELAELFVGVVSHDLRNPLNVIMLNTALLQRGPALPEPATAAVGRIRTSGERAMRLIRDLLDFTQARMGKGLPVTPAACDLHATIRQAIDEVRHAHPGREVALELHEDPNGICDADRIAQLVTNLVVNALVHGAPDRPVAVRVDGDADVVTITVRNEGDPIPPELLGVLFEPLRRGSSRNGGGNIGLGLFIVDQIARAHGGSVEVRSSPGDGTTFRVRMPRYAS